MSVILLDRDVVHYESLGRGRPLILLHSWVGSWRYWIPAMQAACGSFRVYALDLWGYGDSSRNIGLYAIAQQIELVNRFLSEMGIGRVAVVGHGLGAVLGELFAAAFPDRVDRLMCVSYPSSVRGLQERMVSGAPGTIVDWLMDREASDPAVRVEALKCDPRSLAAAIQAVAGMDLNAMVMNSSIARLLVYGSRDPLSPPSGLELPNQLPENSHAVVLEDSGHYPMIQDIARFNRLLLDFITLVPGESPRSLLLKDEWKRRVR